MNGLIGLASTGRCGLADRVGKKFLRWIIALATNPVDSFLGYKRPHEPPIVHSIRTRDKQDTLLLQLFRWQPNARQRTTTRARTR